MTQQQRNKRILKILDAKTVRGLASRQAAREILISEGIYTRKGKLKVSFGGPGTRAKAVA